MNELYPLRPHQQDALNMLKESFKQGKTRPLVYAATGWGKTVLAAHIVEGALNKGKRVCFIAPYITLINQTAKSLMDQGLPQPGIIQSNHPWSNPELRFQVASVQTLSRRTVEEFDLYIVDECDLLYSFVRELIETTDKPVIGLTATPYRKGLGKYYNNLISSITVEQLIEQGYLCNYKAWAPCQPDMKGVKVNTVGEYQESQAADKMMTPQITGSITDTWLRLGENEPTLCYATSVIHANHIGNEFDRLGISNRVITAATDTEEREEVYDDFSNRKITVLISVMVLVAGFDREVFNLILARPIKSDRVFMQIFGRGLRVNEGKDFLRVFDHGGNIERLGYPEHIHIDELDTGEAKEANSAKQTEEREEKKPKKCPKCHIMKDAGVNECPSCGFAPRRSEDVEVQDGELIQIKGPEKSKKATKDDKQKFWSELLGYRKILRARGKNYKDGWFSNKYREKFNVWPRGLSDISTDPTESTLGWIKSQQIAFSKSKEKR